MNELVSIKGNDIFTDSLVIANGTGNKHRSVQRVIDKYILSIEQFGKVRFKIAPTSSGQEQKVYQLNEQQATFLITLLRNTDTVVKFKIELVRQFFEMRKFILERQSKVWIETRQQGKIIRNSETDVIKQLVEYAKEQGSTHSDKLYVTYSKLANKSAGITKRDEANTFQLNNLSLMEHTILKCIQIGIAMDKPYKEIYQDCKRRLETIKDLAYLDVTA
ncbi:MAG: Rha family transcriptional regulator [Lachnotalea sp.]